MKARVPGRLNFQSFQRGSIYLAVLFTVAFVGIAASGASTVWVTERQREREKELLNEGAEFQQAIRSYYLSSPGSVKVYPARLEDLLLDSRFLFVKRHLRQIYVDPMTGTRDWKLVIAPQGGIMGVASQSSQQPIKVDQFEDSMANLAGAKSYSDWKFIYQP